MKTSAGIMLYKKVGNVLEVFLVHSGGPFWANKDLGTWSIPKGIVEEGEDYKKAAMREVKEELGIDININIYELIYLGTIVQKSSKTVYGFAYKTSLRDIKTKSNTIYMEWPPKSGKKIEVPEIDKGEWFDLETAAKKINPDQAPFLDKLLAIV